MNLPSNMEQHDFPGTSRWAGELGDFGSVVNGIAWKKGSQKVPRHWGGRGDVGLGPAGGQEEETSGPASALYIGGLGDEVPRRWEFPLCSRRQFVPCRKLVFCSGAEGRGEAGRGMCVSLAGSIGNE